jgi:hypothetical protein
MDLQNNLSVAETGLPMGATVDKVASALAHGIVTNAKTKKAQKAAENGQYWTLDPYDKSLIQIPQYIINQVSGQGISYYAVLQLPAQGTGSSNTQIIEALKILTKNPNLLGVTGQAAKPESQGVIGGAAASLPKSAGIISSTGENIKKYLPYIIGGLLVVIIIYFIVKRKK